MAMFRQPGIFPDTPSAAAPMKEFLKSLLASVLGTFLAGALCAFLLLVLIVAGLGASGAGAPTVTVRPGTLLLVGHGLVVNDTPEHGSPGLGSLFGDDPRPTVDLYRALAALELAGKDRNIVGVVISGEIAAGVVQLGELRKAIAEFRKETGKPVFAWIENGDQAEYYLASVADQVWMHPAGELELKGLASTHMYFGETLKTLGIGVQVTKVGKYKSAVEPFLGDRMSDPSREQATQLVQGVWSRLVGQIAQSRKLTNAALNRAADAGGLFPAKQALAQKLVDGLLQRDEFIERMRKAGAAADEGRTSFRQVSLAQYAGKVQLPRGSDRVAVVYAEGEIVDGWGAPDEVGGDRLAFELRRLRGDERVKAVVLRVNSPGGSAFASDLVAREVALLRKKGLPVVVSMGDVAASGGYYIAARGTVIMADPATITGSIGVFGLQFNYEELARKFHLAHDGVKTNRFADLGQSHRAATPEELALIQGMVDEVYEDFLKVVAEGRKLQRDAVHEIAQGRVWLGASARERELVDKFGGLRDAIALAKSLAELKEAELVQVPALHEGRESLLQQMLADGHEEHPLFTRSAPRDPALLFLRSHAETLRAIRALNDPQGLYLTCPFRLERR
jgi:protease-4